MKQKLTKLGVKSFLAPIQWIIITGICFFLAADEIFILRAWIYIGIYSVGGLIIGVILFKNSPKLLNERGKMQKGTKQFDKYIILTFFSICI